MTISLFRVADVSRYGSVSVNSDGLVINFHEKSVNFCNPGLINAGVSLVSRSFMDALPEQNQFSMETEVFPKVANTGRMFGLEQKGPFFDIGTPESYREFQEFVSNGAIRV